MTAASIRASRGDYAGYLHDRTVAPELGDYYLGRDGLPAEAPGRWIGEADALARVGLPAGPVAPDDLRAMMAGHRPGHPEAFLRAAGPDGTRAGGIDITFSAPKSVSVAWAMGDATARAAIEQAHHDAVQRAVIYLGKSVELTARWDPEQGMSVPALAAHLHAAEFTHTTARGVGEAAPDPQLHSHVVITSVEREDGRVAAVRSRPMMRAAREGGAMYRAALAHELRQQGYVIEPAGDDGRYFRLANIDPQVEQAFSKRTVEVQHAARAFRAEHGRAPERGELRALAVKTRSAKAPHTRHELDASWRATAAVNGLERPPAPELRAPEPVTLPVDGEGWALAVERETTADRAVFDSALLRTVALEQAAGHGLDPDAALAGADRLRDEGRVLELADGRLTTSRVREAEQTISDSLAAMAADPGRVIDAAAREAGIAAVERRIGAELSAEQRAAIDTVTAPSRAAVLIGPAGTGKGVVIDAAAHAERTAGREVYGVAVAGRTAQRLGESAPSLAGRVKTIDGFVNAVERGRLPLDANTTVYVDEAGMGDTDRLHRLTELVSERGGALVAIGDGRQLSSIGAGGMFDRLATELPAAELRTVHRTNDPAEQDAWHALRSCEARAALAFYRERGAVHLADTRDDAIEQAARAYDRHAAEHGHAQVALMSDASNVEIDHLNLRVQALRRQREELSPEHVEHPDGYPLHAGDRVIWTRPMPVRSGPRVENGQRGEIVDLGTDRLAVQLDSGDRVVTLDTDRLDAVRLGYATHVVREQGATVERSVVVTGGWQTSAETAYVEATRGGVEWHVGRDDLDGHDDAGRLDHLAERMNVSRAQEPSLTVELHDPRRLPDDPLDAFSVERLQPVAITDLAPEHGHDLAVER
ncbi:MobF family relaxase [Conexibacter sp. JD483]|uniref:MobF family relaxase n=1 Tax=unclassified Conexibacter TaxID=2627773 RepID=UPI002723AC14|nr:MULTISPECIES: MobF family relaxase [unclassified Conexibacter]MDO8186471.1 MobF family relaxase [Conexibacter sp. CPCC 205706]MDO8200040.1 MobF family relaxase [Conexibacter sp. CPCC 205762]MDR9370884.1 MobF family relaxase [Conexibacter sp. JD483]